MTDEGDRIPQSPAALPSVVVPQPLSSQAQLVRVNATVLGHGLFTKTCPQCGRNPASRDPAVLELVQLPAGVFIAAAFSAWLGAIVWHFARRTFTARVTLCDECLAAHKQGVLWRRAGLVGFMLAPGPLTVLLPLLSPQLPLSVMVWSVLSVVGGVGCIAAFRRTRDTVLRLSGPPSLDEVPLLVSSTFAEVVAREAPHALKRPRD